MLQIPNSWAIERAFLVQQKRAAMRPSASCLTHVESQDGVSALSLMCKGGLHGDACLGKAWLWQELETPGVSTCRISGLQVCHHDRASRVSHM